MSFVLELAKRLWFKENSTRAVITGPYRGLRFRITPQLRTRMIVFRAAYEPAVQAEMLRTITPGMTIIDIGAHVGIHALYAAKLLNGKCRVVAFEPWPDNYLSLAANVRANRAYEECMLLIQKAVGSKDGSITMVRGISDGTHFVSTDPADKGTTVETVTLDSFCEVMRLVPSLLLIDVEGAELSVLCGSEGVLVAHHPTIILEHHGESLRLQASEFLSKIGYAVGPLGARHLLARPKGV